MPVSPLCALGPTAEFRSGALSPPHCSSRGLSGSFIPTLPLSWFSLLLWSSPFSAPWESVCGWPVFPPHPGLKMPFFCCHTQLGGVSFHGLGNRAGRKATSQTLKGVCFDAFLKETAPSFQACFWEAPQYSNSQFFVQGLFFFFSFGTLSGSLLYPQCSEILQRCVLVSWSFVILSPGHLTMCLIIPYLWSFFGFVFTVSGILFYQWLDLFRLILFFPFHLWILLSEKFPWLYLLLSLDCISSLDFFYFKVFLILRFKKSIPFLWYRSLLWGYQGSGAFIFFSHPHHCLQPCVRECRPQLGHL